MKKRDPLSTPETMGTPASPRQKPLKRRRPFHGCSSGLVGGVLALSTVSEMDTFIEKPFSVLSLSVCICFADSAKHREAPRARAVFGDPKGH